MKESGLVLSAGLFVGTALFAEWSQKPSKLKNFVCDACYWLLNHLQNEDLSRDPNMGMDWYQLRRLKDRLSYHNLMDIASSVDDDLGKDPFDAAVSEGEEPSNEEWPKNSNWHHFELSPTEEKEDQKQSQHEQNRSVSRKLPGSRAATNLPSEHLSEPLPSEHIPPVSRTATLHRSISLDDRAVFNDFSSDGPEEPSSSVERSNMPPKTLRRSVSIPDLHPRALNKYDRTLVDVVRHQNRAARSHYNSRIMPNKLILVRHGQSMGNIDERLYSATPDNAMPLTKLGWEQAKAAGKHLRENVLPKSGRVHFIVSPYVRATETFHGIVSAWSDPSAEFGHIKNRDLRLKAWYNRLMELGLTWNEDPRIREQDFGNYQDPVKIREAKRDRHRFGVFYYRFPHGESAADVFDRISTFLDSLWRSFDMNASRNYVIVTHGICFRVLLARYFRYTIEQFNLLSNPHNCEMVVLTHDGHGRLQLSGRYQLELEDDEETKERHVVGISWHKRLQVLPTEYIRKVKVRICYED